MEEDTLQIIKELRLKHKSHPVKKLTDKIAFIKNKIIGKHVTSVDDFNLQLKLLKMEKDWQINNLDEQDIKNINKVVEAFDAHLTLLTITEA